MEHKDYKYNHYRRDKTEDKRKRDTSRSRDRDRKAWKVCCAVFCAGRMGSSLNLGPILILLKKVPQYKNFSKEAHNFENNP